MQETANASALPPPTLHTSLASRVRAEAPSLTAVAIAVGSAILLILSFPDFDLWPLAWVALTPLLVTVAYKPSPVRAFLLGWLTGSVFFYGSCYWLTFSIINYGGINPVIAYLLLVPGALTLGIFFALFTLFVATAVRFFGEKGLLLASLMWPVLEWARLALTGQLWNALGYSQAYQPSLIQTASWGGVYAVSFLIVTVNCAGAFVVVKRSKRALLIAAGVILAVVAVILYANQWFLRIEAERLVRRPTDLVRIFALQPNVPMTLVKSDEEMRQLTERHIRLTEELLQQSPEDGVRRLVVWPESPMNFEYARDSEFQSLVTNFARQHKTALIFNSQEPAPNNGIYNSAMLINEDGRPLGQYDKIRLLPFGEYVPLPRWLPGANLITGIVGDFTPGANYTIFRVGEVNFGVFICVESAYPSIARAFASNDANVLINISNDGYLGRTAVMKQHLANAVFRAVENGRPVVRVTNTGITAYIDHRGRVYQQTPSFEPATRTWEVNRYRVTKTFYTRHGDLFVLILGMVSFLVLGAHLVRRRTPGSRA